MRWLLDTNVVSETIRRRPHAAVLQWTSRLGPGEAAASLVTMAELADGIETAPHQERREELNLWLANIVSSWLSNQVLPLTQEILIHWLRLSRALAARRISRKAPDLLIAATASVHHLSLVTRNVRDFADTGIVVYDPWHDQTHHMNEP